MIHSDSSPCSVVGRFRPWALLLVVAFLPITARAAIGLRVEGNLVDPGKAEAFAIRASGNEIIIEHQGMVATCCYIADARLSIHGNRLVIHEANAGRMCRCLGTFDLSFTIRRLLPGIYDVTLLGLSGNAIAEGSVEVKAAVTQQKVWEDCSERPTAPEVAIRVDGDAVAIEHRSARADSCLVFEAGVEVAGNTVRVRELGHGACQCVGTYDLGVELPGLPPGTWKIELYDFEGTLAGSETVEIAFPRLIATSARTPRSDPVEAEIDIVRSEGTEAIVERYDVTMNCCLVFDATATIAAGEIHVTEIDRGPPCDCISVFNVRVEALDLEPGDYKVLLTPAGGNEVKGEVTVAPHFIRGAVTGGDVDINISDGISILLYLFVGGDAPCRDAADVNDDGSLDITDAVFLLNYLFLGGDPPKAPFATPGIDPTPDGIDCLEPPCRAEKFTYLAPPPGQVYDFVEFCVLADQGIQDQVLAIYPEVRFSPGAPGRIGCSNVQVLGMIDWKDLDPAKLCALSLFDTIAEFRGSFSE